MNAPTKTDQPKLQKVVLRKPHTHAGQKYAAGDAIDVHEADAAWLAENGVIDAPAQMPVSADPKAAPKA